MEYWLKKFFTSGVFNGDLQVTESSGMTLEVGSGYTNADGKVKFWNAPFNVTLDAANSTYPRIDTIVIRRDNVNRTITCEKVTGQYSGDTPQPTAPTRNGEIYELVIAQISVAAGATGITQADITDTRPDPNLCGYIVGTVTEMDFSQFTAQFESYFTQFKAQHEHEWSVWEQTQVAAYAAWFANVQAQQIADKADWDQWYADLQEELHMLPPDSAEYLQVQIDEIRENGTTGSIFHVTTINSELEGKTVTVSCGTEVRTATFDENLECSVVGFKSVGAVTITSTDGIQTATSIVNIDYYSKYEVPIAFWSATVNIQGDDNLKGATITVKDSDDLTVATIVLNVITGQGVFNAQKADTYTFNYTVSGTSYSESLAVTEETTYSLSLSAGFDWQTWVTEGGLDPTDYEDLDELLEDETALRRLFTVHASTDYMCTVVDVNADLEKIIYNDLCAKWINLRDYALDNMAANSAIKAVMDEADKYGYGEWALVGQVPRMSSNTAPYGVASASDTLSGYDAYKAFDGDDSTYWHSNNSVDAHVLQYTFVEPVKVSQFGFKSRNLLGRVPTSIELQGSNTPNNGASFVSIKTVVPSSVENELQIFNVSENDTAYLGYRIILRMARAEYVDVISLQFYAWAPKGNVPIMTANTAPYGEAIKSTEYNSTYAAYSAFNDSAYGWTPATSDTLGNCYVGYKFVNPICVKKMMIFTPTAGTTTRISAFKLQGSNSGNSNDWTDLLTVTNKVNGLDYYEVDNNNYYMYLRVLITAGATIASTAIIIQSLQFYGRELKVSVPKMDTNTTPYGEAYSSAQVTNYPAFQCFDGDDSTSGSFTNAVNNFISYKFRHPVKLKKARIVFPSANTDKYTIKGSNDRTTWESVSNEFTGGATQVVDTFGDAYKYFAVMETTKVTGNYYCSFNTIQFYGLDYSEREFETGVTKKWLYDHGLFLDGQSWANDATWASAVSKVGSPVDIGDGVRIQNTAGGNDTVTLVATNNAVDFTPYSLLRMRKNIGTNTNVGVSVASINTQAYISVASTINGSGLKLIRLDVSTSKTNLGSNSIANVTETSNNIADVLELWLE
jgi:hypothetical protein